MENKETIENSDIEQEESLLYQPSSAEKKKAIMMYLFFGIMVYLAKKDVTIFEYYHLKQSSGRWILFLLVLVVDIVLLFIPGLRVLGLIPLLLLVVAWGISVKQAREGKYSIGKKTNVMNLFGGVGNRFIELFELNVHQMTPDMQSIDTTQLEGNQNNSQQKS